MSLVGCLVTFLDLARLPPVHDIYLITDLPTIGSLLPPPHAHTHTHRLPLPPASPPPLPHTPHAAPSPRLLPSPYHRCIHHTHTHISHHAHTLPAHTHLRTRAQHACLHTHRCSPAALSHSLPHTFTHCPHIHTPCPPTPHPHTPPPWWEVCRQGGPVC